MAKPRLSLVRRKLLRWYDKNRRDLPWRVTPDCGHCPIAQYCAGRLSRFDRSKKRSKTTQGIKNVDWPLALIIGNNHKILLRRRTTHGILAGLWELPGSERRIRETRRATLERNLKGLDGALKYEGMTGQFRHTITNRKINSSVFLFSILPGTKVKLPDRNWRWFTPSSLSAHPIAAMTHKAIRLVDSAGN